MVSPWLDLTHSFPSILQNTATDIIPPYGFMHKPSVMWPPPSADEQARIQGYTSISAIRERQADRQNSRKGSGLQSLKDLVISPRKSSYGLQTDSSPQSVTRKESRAPHEPDYPIPMEEHGEGNTIIEEPETFEELQGYHGKDAGSRGEKPAGRVGKHAEKETQESTEPDEHVRLSVDGKDISLNEQIQFYALNSRKQENHSYAYFEAFIDFSRHLRTNIPIRLPRSSTKPRRAARLADCRAFLHCTWKLLLNH